MAGRKPDSPGVSRIKRQTDGRWLLSGISTTGKRIRIPGLTYADAERTQAEVFGYVSGPGQNAGSNPLSPIVPITPVGPSDDKPRLDDFGLAIGVSVDNAAKVNAAFGIPPVGAAPTVTLVKTGEQVAIDADKKVKRAKQAKSLMELAGVSWAAGSVWAGRRMIVAAGKEPVNPNPRQVNDLADCTKETFVEWFGDRDIKPWQMMLLLTIGIPLSMFIQSPSKKKVSTDHLKSVP